MRYIVIQFHFFYKKSMMNDEKDEEAEKKDHMDKMITNWRWLILDGPVDTIWVENLNTVLDDSKVLCLANGHRIGLPNGMRLVFEVDNLSEASPATISRCAMVYMVMVWWNRVKGVWQSDPSNTLILLNFT